MASAELSVAWPRLTPDQAAELRAKADALYAAEDYTAAEELFGQLVASGFEPAWCRFQWGRIAGRLGRWAEAVERLDQAIDIEQPNSWAYFERSQALVKSLGEEAAAIGDLVRFVETAPAALAPAHFDALVRAAHAAFDRQAYIEAEKLYTFITSNGEGGYVSKLRCADLLQLKGKARQATAILDNLRGHPEYDCWGDFTSGLAYSQLKNRSLAAEYFEKALIAAPDNPHFWDRLLLELESVGASSKIWLHHERLDNLPVESRSKIVAFVRLQERDLPRFRSAYSGLSARDQPAVNERVAKLIYKLAQEQHLRAIEQLIIATHAVEDCNSDLICAAITAYCGQKDWAAAESLILRAQSKLNTVADERFAICQLQYYSYTMQYENALAVVRQWPDGAMLPQTAQGLVAALYAALGRWDDVLLFLRGQISAGLTAIDELLAEAVARAARHTGRQAEICDLLSPLFGEGSAKPLLNLRNQLVEEQHWLRSVSAGISAVSPDAYPVEGLDDFRRQRTSLLIRSLSTKSPAPMSRTIYLCSDANYLIGACVSLYSLLHNNIGLTDHIRFRLYVQADVLSLAERVVGAISKAFSTEITTISADTLVDASVQFRTGWGLFTPGHGLSQAAYHRIYAARQLLNEGVGGRALYLDSDTIVARGIDEVIDFELDGAPLGARQELPLPEIFHAADKLGVSRELYFNSGVLLFDLSHPHLVAMLDQAIDFSLNQPEMLTFVDQCALNWAFHDQTCALPSHCNHFLRQNDPMRLFVQDPTVIHFLDRPKPWDPMYRNANCVRWLREFASLGDVTGSQALGELISLSLRPSVRPAQLSA